MVTAVLFAVPAAAGAAPPDPSAVSASATTLDRGQTFTVTQEVYNANSFSIMGARPTLIGLVDVADIVSCDGSVFSCDVSLDSFRSFAGNLAPGATHTITWTLRIKDDAAPGAVQLRHQLDGEDFAFPSVAGPTLTITGPTLADLGVSINATPRQVNTSRITYSITVHNAGPANATGIRLVANYAKGLVFVSSGDCASVGATRTVNCDIASLASGASATATFVARAQLLAIGALTTTVQRTQSTPADPNAANDRASKTCTALTGLLVRC
ncbi:MAG TPA: DUF11 domain-containing protein [Actinophytocola sp.]|nr:DUF11 domain-containing protein [Actinophytocola sp.]